MIGLVEACVISAYAGVFMCMGRGVVMKQCVAVLAAYRDFFRSPKRRFHSLFKEQTSSKLNVGQSKLKPSH